MVVCLAKRAPDVVGGRDDQAPGLVDGLGPLAAGAAFGHRQRLDRLDGAIAALRGPRGPARQGRAGRADRVEGIGFALAVAIGAIGAVDLHDPHAGGEALARAQCQSLNETVKQSLIDAVERRRNDPEFKARLSTIIERDRELLERLAT